MCDFRFNRRFVEMLCGAGYSSFEWIVRNKAEIIGIVYDLDINVSSKRLGIMERAVYSHCR